MGSFLTSGGSWAPPGGPTIQLGSDVFRLGVVSDPTGLGLIPTRLSPLQTPITSSDCCLCFCWPSPCVCVCVCSIAQSCLTLCNPREYSTPASSVHGIFQVRILGWVAISYSPGHLPDPGIKSSSLASPELAGLAPPGKSDPLPRFDNLLQQMEETHMGKGCGASIPSQVCPSTSACSPTQSPLNPTLQGFFREASLYRHNSSIIDHW